MQAIEGIALFLKSNKAKASVNVTNKRKENCMMRKNLLLGAAALIPFLCAYPALAQDAQTGGVVVTNNYSQSCRVSINQLNILMTVCGQSLTDTAPAKTGGTPGHVTINTPLSCPCVTEVKVKCGLLYEETIPYAANYASACVKHNITIKDNGYVNK